MIDLNGFKTPHFEADPKGSACIQPLSLFSPHFEGGENLGLLVEV